VLAQITPGTRYSAVPPYRSQPVFAREDSAGPPKQAEHPACILIVEDDFLVADAIDRALADAGFDVAGVAVSADEAIELAESQKPTLVVMDVRLAGEGDGIHAALEIFRKFGVRCIFATAHYDQDSRERAQPAMPLGWLQKPYPMLSLVNAIRHALERVGVELNREGFPNRVEHDSSLRPGGGWRGWRMGRLFAFE
jgi:two-component system, response regulator PdtaR